MISARRLAVNGLGQVVIALSGGEILYFEIDESHTLNEVAKRRGLSPTHNNDNDNDHTNHDNNNNNTNNEYDLQTINQKCNKIHKHTILINNNA